MSTCEPIARRRFLALPLALAGLALSPRAINSVFAETLLKRTPNNDIGPFYPVIKPLDQDADLTVLDGKSGHAQGQVIHVTGQVFNTRGKPVQGARIEMWQANANGRYNHPSDRNPAPLDPNFQGYGVQVTDEDGRYHFKTVKPGAYPTGRGDWWRPPHIHFDVMGHSDRVVTQMFFDGEALNEKDILLNSVLSNKEGVIVKLQPPTDGLEPESFLVAFSIVLISG